MYEMTCPWCEVDLPLSFADVNAQQTCPECRTTWSFEDDSAPLERELAFAA